MLSNTNFALWPIAPFGGENENAGNTGTQDSGNNSGQQSTGEASQGNSGQGNQNSQTNESGTNTSDDDDDDDLEGLSAKELKRIARDNAKRAKDAETERDSVKNALTDKEREKLDKEQRQELEINDLKSENSALRTALAKQSIINAINSDKRYEWNSAEIVAAQLNSEIVKVDKDGNVQGLKKELDRIAKDDDLKFLLKSGGKQEDQQQQQNNGGNQGNGFGATGFQPGQGGANSGGGKTPTLTEAAQEWPSLAGRI